MKRRIPSCTFLVCTPGTITPRGSDRCQVTVLSLLLFALSAPPSPPLLVDAIYVAVAVAFASILAYLSETSEHKRSARAIHVKANSRGALFTVHRSIRGENISSVVFSLRKFTQAERRRGSSLSFASFISDNQVKCVERNSPSRRLRLLSSELFWT